jgi:chromosome segregation ATPase
MNSAALGTLIAALGVLVTIVVFVFSRITARFTAVETTAAARFESVRTEGDKQRKELADDIAAISRKLSHNTKALTKITQNQRVQTQVVSKLISEQETLEEAVSELKTVTRLLSQQMSQHQEWHRNMLEAVDQAAGRGRNGVPGVA